jgi:hypothetical protein
MTRTLMLSASGAVMAAWLIMTGMASAQTMTTTSTSTTSSSGVLSTSSATATKKKPTSATPDMVNEAIQRSEARAAKEAASGVPQKWGSEEPFTYNPTVKRFDKSMQ